MAFPVEDGEVKGGGAWQLQRNKEPTLGGP